jgi:hypothetical protein
MKTDNKILMMTTKQIKILDIYYDNNQRHGQRPHRSGRPSGVIPPPVVLDDDSSNSSGGDVSKFSDAAIASNDADHHYDDNVMIGGMMTTTVAAAYEYSCSGALLPPPSASSSADGGCFLGGDPSLNDKCVNAAPGHLLSLLHIPDAGLRGLGVHANNRALHPIQPLPPLIPRRHVRPGP